MSGGMVRALAIGLAALAGFVDAMGFLTLGGFYVAFMSGNSTLLSVGLATGTESRILLAGGLVASFVAGVALSTLLGMRAGVHRLSAVLVGVALLLAAAWALHAGRFETEAGLVLALAMGAENTAFQKQGQSGIGLTYMTGTLVRLGQRLGEAVAGAAWGPLVPDLLLWSGMLVGALLGAVLWRGVGLVGLWAGVAAALAMAGVAWWAVRRGMRG